MAHMTKGHLASLLMAALRKQPAGLEGAGREAAAEGLSTPAGGRGLGREVVLLQTLSQT